MFIKYLKAKSKIIFFRFNYSIFSIIFFAFITSSCGYVNNDNSAADGASVKNEIVSETETILNTVSEDHSNDFSFYTLDGKLIISLLAREDDIDYDDPDVKKALSGFDIINFNDKNPNDIYVDKLLYSRGSSQVIQTGKFLRTAGNSGGTYVVSSGNDVIKSYGIDTENEEYLTEDNEIFKIIALYFYINADGTIERIKYQKNTDISSLALLDNANACIKFNISKRTNNITSISMEYMYKGNI